MNREPCEPGRKRSSEDCTARIRAAALRDEAENLQDEILALKMALTRVLNMLDDSVPESSWPIIRKRFRALAGEPFDG